MRSKKGTKIDRQPKLIQPNHDAFDPRRHEHTFGTCPANGVILRHLQPRAGLKPYPQIRHPITIVRQVRQVRPVRPATPWSSASIIVF
ncbi:MAG: hypothetical protein ACI304_03765 [Lepagella sp.]